MSTERIRRALDHAGEVKIAVLGDYTLDRYLYYDPKRDEPSVETGRTAFQIERTEEYPGSAGTVVNNLCSLGVKAYCVGFTGDDGEGYVLRKKLAEEGADTGGLVVSDRLMTCTYNKPMRKREDGSYTETNRLDIRNFVRIDPGLEEKLYHNAVRALDQADALIILDQFVQRNMGTLTDQLREKMNALAKERPDKIFYVDSRGFSGEYRNMIVKCNASELARIPPESGEPMTEEEMIEKMMALREKNHTEFFLTRGDKGILVVGKEGVSHVDAYRVEGPIDIVGAGDAATAGIMTGLCLGLTQQEAAQLGCAVSSVTIRQIGKTGTASIGQVKEALK